MTENAENTLGDEVEHTLPPLKYGCTPWRASTQRAADLYDSGIRLWKKEDFVNIEQQLSQSAVMEHFTIRRFDGSSVRIQNPMFGVQKPIWRPYVKFQDYWKLVRTVPDGPPETYNCTYLIDWVNDSIRNYEGPIANASRLFEAAKKRWDNSAACETFSDEFRKLLFRTDNSMKKVTKIVCFGLGDMNRKPPDWWRFQNEARPEDKRELETSVISGALIDHAIALTMHDIINTLSSIGTVDGTKVRLLTQDPNYAQETQDIIRPLGFEVVGEYGAEGFTELDDECVVFAPFVQAPVSQIVADLARPVIIICPEHDDLVFNENGKPFTNAESPRTRQMWREYSALDFPLASDTVGLKSSLRQLKMYTKLEEARTERVDTVPSTITSSL